MQFTCNYWSRLVFVIIPCSDLLALIYLNRLYEIRLYSYTVDFKRNALFHRISLLLKLVIQVTNHLKNLWKVPSEKIGRHGLTILYSISSSAIFLVYIVYIGELLMWIHLIIMQWTRITEWNDIYMTSKLFSIYIR